MIRTILQVIAFFFPPPFNVWLHRLYGARIGKRVRIHPGVMIIARKLEIGDAAKIRFGTMVNIRSFKVGRKSLIGYFLIAKGISNLHIGDACVIGPKTIINCDCPVTLGYYCGIGPGSSLFTHGSLLPVTEGYKATFGPIEMKDKSWVTLRCTVGPNVTIGEKSIAMPGTVLLESIASGRMVSGDPAKLINIPNITLGKQITDLESFAGKLLAAYCEWSNENFDTQWEIKSGVLYIKKRWRTYTISINEESSIVLLTRSGETRNGMYFNIADLTTDPAHSRIKEHFDDYMRLYYGLTFLPQIV